MGTLLIQTQPHRAAIGRHLIIGIIAALSLGCGNIEEQKRSEEVKAVSQAFLKRINDAPSGEDKSAWGMNQLYLFGPPLFWKNDIETKPMDDPFLNYQATAVVWYHGTTPGGQSVKEQRTIIMQVKPGEGPGWGVTGYTLSESSSLSFWKQLGYWILWSYLGPIVVLCMSGSLFEFNSILSGFLLLLFFIGAIIWSGIISYYSFGSGVAVVVCTPVFAFINLYLIGLLLSRKSQSSSSQAS